MIRTQCQEPGQLALEPARPRGTAPTPPPGPCVLTIGHSTQALEAFLATLQAHDVTLLADVRAFPRSRRNPQFNTEALPAALSGAGIAYRHFPALGGRRRPLPDSPNAAWRDPGFRGYADYMATPEFAGGIATLLDAARAGRVAIMCAEAAPWRCHRSLIADALLARGADVAHIMGPEPARPHRPPPFARFSGTSVTYPALLTD
jgi:uncharacterized protein (DUF488 family)